MKYLLAILISCTLCIGLSAQIIYAGCTDLITGPSPYTLSLNGTTDDGGTIRNTYTSPPVSCSAGSCSFTVSWNTGEQRWELVLNATDLLHFNSTPSVPDPPDLSLGTWVNQSGCSGITTFSGNVQSSTTLPVELVSFRAIANAKTVHLEWQTNSESGNEKFEIEASFDGREFGKVGEINGHGTSTVERTYLFEVVSPRTGLNYYRLKHIDFDGEFGYSRVLKVNFSGGSQQVGSIYPNPAHPGIVNLDYTAESARTIHVSIIDMTGQLVFSQPLSVVTGNNQLNLDCSTCRKGAYLVKVDTDRMSTYRRFMLE